MKLQLEHANITVRNTDAAVKFFTAAFPDFKIRGKGQGWLHLGTDSTYIAIEQGKSPSALDQNRHSDVGINHLGFVVDDIQSLEERLNQAGFKQGFKVGPHPFRKRVYFLDEDGMEYEFIQYFSDKSEERNDYKL